MALTYQKLAAEITKCHSYTYKQAYERADKLFGEDLAAVLRPYWPATIDPYGQILFQVRKDVMAMLVGRRKYIEIIQESKLVHIPFGVGGKPKEKGRTIKIAFPPDYMHAILDRYAWKLLFVGVDDEHYLLPAVHVEPSPRGKS